MSKTKGAREGRAQVISNQVFVGAPWHRVRPKYERIISGLRTRFPLSFVIVGRQDGQDAADLLTTIKDRIGTSSYAVFDATGGNPNVSLEFGYAEAMDIDRALYFSTHAATKQRSQDTPIIADLAGKRRNQYAQEKGLQKLLVQLCRDHDYTTRFEKFLQRGYGRAGKGKKKRARALALKTIHALDGAASRRRDDVVQSLLTDQSGYTRSEIEQLIKKMRDAGLIRSVQGPYSRLWIT